MINDPFKYEILARGLLKEIKKCPSDVEQLEILKTILAMSTSSINVTFLTQLLTKENQCPQKATQSKTSNQTGHILKIGTPIFKTYHKSIKQKLRHSIIAQAVYIGLCSNSNDLNHTEHTPRERKEMSILTNKKYPKLSTHQPIKILVIGHSKDQLSQLDWLNNPEFTIDLASNGIMALEKVDNGYDLLFMKSDMPSGLSGLDVIKILQEMRPEQKVPVILV